MAKYSTQAIDKVSKMLSNKNYRVIDGETQSMIIDSLFDRKYVDWPPHWKSERFAPIDNIRDAFDLLTETCPTVDFNLEFSNKDKMWEAYVENEKYSVSFGSPARTIVLAIWNRFQLKTEAAQKAAV